MRLSGALLVLTLALGFSADWARFRGPNGSRVGDGTNLPVEFGPGKNVAWKMAVPFGRSSPIVAAGHVSLTASEGGRAADASVRGAERKRVMAAGSEASGDSG